MLVDRRQKHNEILFLIHTGHAYYFLPYFYSVFTTTEVILIPICDKEGTEA